MDKRIKNLWWAQGKPHPHTGKGVSNIKLREKICKDCGQVFRGFMGKNKLFCPACCKKRNRKSKIKYALRTYGKRKKNPQYRLSCRIGYQIYKALKGKKEGRHWENLVGYTLNELVEHLEGQFDKDMGWDNYGSYWEIDHVRPKSWFDYENIESVQFQECWALSNLQPLGVSKNRSKHNRYAG